MKKNDLLIPISYLDILIDTASKFQVYKKDIIKRCNLPLSLIMPKNRPEYINFRDWIKIISYILDLTNTYGLGYQFGLNCSVTSHEALGFAMISNENLDHVLLDLKKYLSIRLHKVDIEIIKDNNSVDIIFNPIYPLPNSLKVKKIEQINIFLIEAALIGIMKNLESLTKFKISGINIDVTWEKTSYHDIYENKIPPIRFNQNKNKISFDAKCLTYPLTFSSKSAYKIAIDLINQENVVFPNNNHQKILFLVEKNTSFVPNKGYPNLSETAKKLKISERSLKRQLALANTSFSTLIQAKKFSLARKLISSNKSIQEVSDILGYNHPNSFTRAFTKWSGERPSRTIDN